MPVYKKTFIVLALIAASMIAGTLYGFSTSDNLNQLDTASISKSAVQSNNGSDNEVANGSQIIYVYVTGAVNKPGMVELESTNEALRIADAVNACGGLLPTADVDNFNMAEVVTDGQHIRVPEKIVERSVENISEAGAISNSAAVSNNSSSNSSSVNSSSASKNAADNVSVVNINTANAQELTTLKGIGPKMADRIIEYRQNNGPFKSIEEIQNVKGIGAKKFKIIKSRLRI